MLPEESESVVGPDTEVAVAVAVVECMAVMVTMEDSVGRDDEDSVVVELGSSSSSSFSSSAVVVVVGLDSSVEVGTGFGSMVVVAEGVCLVEYTEVNSKSRTYHRHQDRYHPYMDRQSSIPGSSPLSRHTTVSRLDRTFSLTHSLTYWQGREEKDVIHTDK